MGEKIITTNRRAYHEYHVLDKAEAGIALQGTEVKSLRIKGAIQLKDSYVSFDGGEAFLIGAHISPYEQGNIFNTDPLRPKRLLLHKGEIRRLQGAVSRQGYTLVPLQLYLKDGRVKLELGVCRGKQVHDKRDAVAEHDAMRDIERAMRQGRKDYTDE